MNNVKNFAMELEQEVRQYIEAEGTELVRQAYNAPEGLTLDELVECCVGVEYQNAFK